MEWKTEGAKLEVLAGRCHSSVGEVLSVTLCEFQRFSFSFTWHKKLECQEIKKGTEMLERSTRVCYGFRVGNFLIPISIAENGSSPHVLSRSFWSWAQEASLLCFQSLQMAKHLPPTVIAPYSSWAALSVLHSNLLFQIIFKGFRGMLLI